MIRAIHFPDPAEFRAQALPGSLHIDLTRAGPDGSVALWFFCPCGCEGPHRIPVARGAKPATSPSWGWNGSLTEATLTPSVRQLNCGWHGWLRGGYWEVT
jgi:hypothetical protein